ncbi:MAG TPA: methylmalonyl-CoA epimerase [Chloroflexota bacterium]|nr:methylmalonyl-CoA epimerase [Chloroflexota bacterium]
MKPARVDHTAIVVADMDSAIARWQTMTGARISTRQLVADQRVEIAMLELGDTNIELIRPIDDTSGVARFLRTRGESLHHIGLETEDIKASILELIEQGMRFIDSEPRHGAHGLIAFLHPRSTGGVLIELIQLDS